MKRFPTVVFFLILTIACEPGKMTLKSQDDRRAPLTIVIHGGAGTIKKQNMTPHKEKAYRDALKLALDTGYVVLAAGGRSVDAVIAAITVMENSPLFNAGKGAVFTYSGKNELDASIMDGSNLMAGAVAGVTTIRNPIKAAYAVMAQSPHVMLAGRGAERMSDKRYGRVGDSPIIGAGTYAYNKTCGVSGTGWGEFFIREETAELLLSIEGNISMTFNTDGMYRGYIKAGQEAKTFLYRNE
jgi:isoaspartyl peptidase/L-asparaginase-like protein (Ntn-hydrolase superfamily)